MLFILGNQLVTLRVIYSSNPFVWVPRQGITALRNTIAGSLTNMIYVSCPSWCCCNIMGIHLLRVIH